ncbi:MAG: UDP-glucose dehydrogenase family protein [Streptosporangiaceae bacterium]
MSPRGREPDDETCPAVRVTVLGMGRLGLVHAVCLAEFGHSVLALDVDTSKVASAGNGRAPLYEPGLEPLLRKHLAAGRLQFTADYRAAARFGKLHFLCVGTPQSADGRVDLGQVHAAADALAPHLTGRNLVVGRSTVPPGTARAIAGRIRERAPVGADVDVAWNPEFLREGLAVHDSLHPLRLVFGVTCARAGALLREIYARPLSRGTPPLVMDLETAELAKLAANAFLATKLSFINAVADICDRVGADVLRLAEALTLDGRIGDDFLVPGLGYGGGCLPKDTRAFGATAAELGASSLAAILAEVDAINISRRAFVVELARDAVGGSLVGCRVAVLGVAYKPGTDDVRDSASLAVCDRLAGEGASVVVHDPVALDSAAQARPGLRCAKSVGEAAEDADLVLHLTDWDEYRRIDPVELAVVVARRNIVDARSALDERLWRAAGWSFRAMGRR